MSDDDQMTPGPWKDCGPNEDGERCIWGDDGSCVAVTIPVGNPDEREKRSIENACAISATIDLLYALENTAKALERYDSGHPLIAEACIAIAKARGETGETQ